MVQFIILYKVALCFESADDILKFDHLNDSYGTVLFMLYKMVLTF